ncbi:MAG TPA: protein kinase [Gemmatimonadaceae bacterium]|nr:protein kinase [Gemmatimonadaceae bacterium]
MQSLGPSKIGKYDVEERVGEGAMGVVYRAVDPVLKRRVAIKVMSDAFAQDDDLRERFLREAQAAGSLQHPNVITIYDFGDVDGHPYIAMEFVEGQDVAELIAHQVPLSVVDKLDLAIGVLQGLAYAHRRGIVHRDIKPANIRVDEEGKARIMDFGVAHLSSSNMTKSGVMLGTPSYMAPEQITGGKVGPATDVFSAGAVLYELLTGTRPFDGGTLQAVMYRVLSADPAPLATAAPGLPAKLNEVVMRALAKDAEKRYASALDMANDLIAIRAAIDASAALPGTLSLRATIESAIEGRKSREIQRTRNRRVVFSSGGVALAAVLVLAGWALARRGTGASSSAPNGAAPSAVPAGGTQGTSPTTTSITPPPATSEQQPQSPRSPASANQPASNRPAESSTDRAKSSPKNMPKPESNAASVPPSTRPQERVSPNQTPPSSAGLPNATAPTASAPAGPTTTAGSPPPVASPPPAAAPIPAPTSVSVVEVRPSSGGAAPNPAASQTVAANAAAEVGAVIDAYARAIESRNMDELRRAYPAITADQARAFSDFFGSTRTLRATLAVKNLRLDGASATASVAGVYEYTTTNGRTREQTVNFQTELRRDGSVWKLTAVR